MKALHLLRLIMEIIACILDIKMRATARLDESIALAEQAIPSLAPMIKALNLDLDLDYPACVRRAQKFHAN